MRVALKGSRLVIQTPGENVARRQDVRHFLLDEECLPAPPPPRASGG
jgi:hypothetical protein